VSPERGSSSADPGALLEVVSERAYVVYDGKSGAIVHVHGSTTFHGADARSEQEDEARALELARRMGAEAEDLRVLAVNPSELEVMTPLRVDLDGPRLTPDQRPAS
jgi:hypothetical protein